MPDTRDRSTKPDDVRARILEGTWLPPEHYHLDVTTGTISEWVDGHGHTVSIIAWVDEPGGEGVQPAELLWQVRNRLQDLNKELPARETSLAITKIEEAIHWLDARTADRKARGVEGTREP